MNTQENKHSQTEGGELVLYLQPNIQIRVKDNQLQLESEKDTKAIHTLLKEYDARFQLLEGKEGQPLSQSILIVQAAADLNTLKTKLLKHKAIFETGYIKSLGEDPD